MKTLSKSNRMCYSVEEHDGKVRIHLVQYETLEMTKAEFDETRFQAHDINTKESQTIARLVGVMLNREIIADELQDHGDSLGLRANENQKIGNIKSFAEDIMDAACFLKVSQWLRRK